MGDGPSVPRDDNTPFYLLCQWVKATKKEDSLKSPLICLHKISLAAFDLGIRADVRRFGVKDTFDAAAGTDPDITSDNRFRNRIFQIDDISLDTPCDLKTVCVLSAEQPLKESGDHALLANFDKASSD